ncbi:16S rRNA m(2)G-966 methyltransferase [Mizugakiibacter sediminis]|uniref:Ribosomal RNA small subunit methyltransferase D n=1 Tax=Mizugakiibacter sediminis TaxID=1475481 RepID=A0A0K8QM35_9GAMM|nr:16S rRNA (guanine(966)-N(2))-methyltransferase RsmD [Mizugakiibacter sediminis]GAP65766.1 16S rRNA m(2)G-966 methyltransferase [Mizugakiibacter sediminis]
MKRARAVAAGPGRVRIIAGRLRGSKLAVPDLPGLRPTPDRVRETLFNWLAPTIEGARCLDLFAGTGALGIEALSRGAAQATFVERDPRLAAALRDNLARLGQAGGSVECVDAAAFLRGSATPFDLVFLDPPFADARWTDAATALEAGGWLKPGALIYVEAPADAAPALPPAWTPHREGRAGGVRYALYRRGGAIR